MNNKDEIGESIFTSENSVVVQNNEQQQEEEEDLEDQLRRGEELKNLLNNILEDYQSENENSEELSSLESTNASNYKSNFTNEPDEQYKNTSLHSFEQLQVLYQVRVRENQQLNKELDVLKEQIKIEQDAYNKKLLLSEADNNRLNISLQQSKALLIEKNQELDAHVKQIEKLNNYILDMKKSNEKIEEELTFWKTHSNELEQKIELLEKGINKNMSEKYIRSHYEQEIIKLQNALQNTNSDLQKTEQECQEHQNKIKETEHKMEIALSEKAEVINSLTKSLEEAQERCFSLINKNSTLQQEMKNLENQLNSKKDNNLDENSVKNYEEIVTTLQTELSRCLDEQKKKREEISMLDKTLKDYHQKEKKLQNELLFKTMQYDSEKQELSNKISNLEEELNNMRNKVQKLEEEKTKIKDQSFNSSNSSFTSEKYKTKSEQYKKLQEHCKNLEKQLNEAIALKSRYSFCEKQCLKLQETVADLNSKLSESSITITELKEKVALKDERDELLETLKTKAEIFENYMSNKMNSFGQINPELNFSKSSVKVIDMCDNFTQTDAENDPNGYLKDSLQKKLSQSNNKMQELLTDNKKLLDKIIMDRKSYEELEKILFEAINRSNEKCVTLEKDSKKLKQLIEKLCNELKEKDIRNKALSLKIDEAKEFLTLMENMANKHNSKITSEYEQSKMKCEKTLGNIQARILRCIDMTNIKLPKNM